MPVLTTPAVDRLEHEAATTPISEIAAYLQAQIGQRMAAHLAGLGDSRQIGRYSKPGGPTPSLTTERRLREGFKVVKTIVDSYDATTARAWLFGTNSRLDDAAPIEVLGAATETEQLAAVVRAARQLASFST